MFYIGNNENPPITDEICWSLDFRYCGAQLYVFVQIFRTMTEVSRGVGMGTMGAWGEA